MSRRNRTDTNSLTPQRCGYGRSFCFRQTHHMIKLDKKLEGFGFFGTDRAVLLPVQKVCDTPFRRVGRSKGSQLLSRSGLSDEFDNFLVWLHDRRLRG